MRFGLPRTRLSAPVAKKRPARGERSYLSAEAQLKRFAQESGLPFYDPLEAARDAGFLPPDFEERRRG